MKAPVNFSQTELIILDNVKYLKKIEKKTYKEFSLLIGFQNYKPLDIDFIILLCDYYKIKIDLIFDKNFKQTFSCKTVILKIQNKYLKKEIEYLDKKNKYLNKQIMSYYNRSSSMLN